MVLLLETIWSRQPSDYFHALLFHTLLIAIVDWAVHLTIVKYYINIRYIGLVKLKKTLKFGLTNVQNMWLNNFYMFLNVLDQQYVITTEYFVFLS